MINNIYETSFILSLIISSRIQVCQLFKASDGGVHSRQGYFDKGNVIGNGFDKSMLCFHVWQCWLFCCCHGLLGEHLKIFNVLRKGIDHFLIGMLTLRNELRKMLLVILLACAQSLKEEEGENEGKGNG